VLAGVAGDFGCVLGEEELEVLAEVVDGGVDGGGGVAAFGEDEGALEDGLEMEGELFVVVVGFGVRGSLAGGGDVGDEGAGVGVDTGAAGVAEGGVGVEGLLDDGAEEAGEFGRLAGEEGFAEVEVGEEFGEGGWGGVVGGLGEELAGGFVPVLDGGEGEVLFGGEVVEEAAFGDGGGGAEVVDGGVVVAFTAEEGEGGAEEGQFGRRGGHRGEDTN
jgi:hypothetical protein